MHLHIPLKQCNSIHCGKSGVSLLSESSTLILKTITTAKTEWKRFYCLKYMYIHAYVCIYTHIYTTDTQLTLLIICTIGLGKVYVNGNFLNHSFTRRYTYQTVCSQFSWFSSLWFSQTPHILTYLPVTDYSHKSTVLLTPKIIHIYQVYKKNMYTI